MVSPRESKETRHEPTSNLKPRPRGASKSDDLTNHTRKRSVSGGFFAKLPFVRTPSDDASVRTGTAPSIAVAAAAAATSPPKNGSTTRSHSASISSITQQGKYRKRQDSLRKTAILGTGKLNLDTHNVRTDTSLRIPATSDVRDSMDSQRTITSASTAAARFSLNLFSPNSSAESVPTLDSKSSQDTEESLDSTDYRHFKLETPVTSPTGTYSTDDDELSSIRGGSPETESLQVLSKKPSVSSSTSSYYAVPPNLLRHRSSTKTKSPLSLPDYSTLHAEDDEWDYTSTARWGWIVLILTWIVFVVGMGSCFSIWSWAWDVGQTPKAPPELEDDPTLPIVGYYPALLVLTAVMSWVWVVVAWVGMKYFRHAKMAGEEG